MTGPDKKSDNEANARAHADIRVVRAENVHTRALENELVVLDLEKGEYFGLNETAGRLFDELCRGKTPRDVARVLASEVDAEESAILRDLVELTEELLVRGLVVEEQS